MNKLHRYWIDGGLCEMEPRGVFAECVHRIYLQDEADAVIAALEAENERLRRQFSKLSQKLADYTFLPDTKFPAFENGKETGYWDAHEQIEAILSEQEKQP